MIAFSSSSAHQRLRNTLQALFYFLTIVRTRARVTPLIGQRTFQNKVSYHISLYSEVLLHVVSASCLFVCTGWKMQEDYSFDNCTLYRNTLR